MILFLDFDGVLHPEGFIPKGKHFCRLPLLEGLLRDQDHAAVRIVISSTWRETQPIEQLAAIFSPDIRARVVGITPVLDTPGSVHWRYAEIQAWLRGQPGEAQWAALDDAREGFPGRVHRKVVFTNPVCGLTGHDLSVLRNRLKPRRNLQHVAAA